MTRAAEEVRDVWARPARIATLALLVALGVVLFANISSRERATEVERLRAQADAAEIQVQRLSAQVGHNQRAAECRSRATALLDEAISRRDALGWQSLVDRFVAGVPLEDRPAVMAELNNETTAAAVLRARAVTECTDNPDFIPPN